MCRFQLGLTSILSTLLVQTITFEYTDSKGGLFALTVQDSSTGAAISKYSLIRNAGLMADEPLILASSLQTSALSSETSTLRLKS